MLIDDQGRWTRLLLDKDLIRPFGGPLAFNRKRVKIVGERMSVPSKESWLCPPLRTAGKYSEGVADDGNGRD